MTTDFTNTPELPYYAVIFTSLRTDGDDAAYGKMAEAMEKLAAKQPGYLGIESTRGANGLGITVSYWRDEASLKAWKQVTKHLGAQAMGREKWYRWYHVRVARVERGYSYQKKR